MATNPEHKPRIVFLSSRTLDGPRPGDVRIIAAPICDGDEVPLDPSGTHFYTAERYARVGTDALGDESRRWRKIDVDEDSDVLLFFKEIALFFDAEGFESARAKDPDNSKANAIIDAAERGEIGVDEANAQLLEAK
jgi:hypothetical protein